MHWCFCLPLCFLASILLRLVIKWAWYDFAAHCMTVSQTWSIAQERPPHACHCRIAGLSIFQKQHRHHLHSQQRSAYKLQQVTSATKLAQPQAQALRGIVAASRAVSDTPNCAPNKAYHCNFESFDQTCRPGSVTAKQVW